MTPGRIPLSSSDIAAFEIGRPPPLTKMASPLRRRSAFRIATAASLSGTVCGWPVFILSPLTDHVFVCMSTSDQSAPVTSLVRAAVKMVNCNAKLLTLSRWRSSAMKAGIWL